MSERECSGCVFWSEQDAIAQWREESATKDEALHWGECRRRAPQPKQVDFDPDNSWEENHGAQAGAMRRAVWPVTYADDKCGEWRAEAT